MRVANLSTLSEVLSQMGVSPPSTQALERLQLQSFAGELATASETQHETVASARTVQFQAAQSKPEQVTETVQPVKDGLIALAPTNANGEVESAPEAPRPLSSANPIFNLVTSQESGAYASECRAAVDAALREAGMDPSQFKMSFWEEAVGYPGGGYMNRCITVETPEGYRMDFDAAATLRNPRVTAGGIQLLKSGYWNTTAAVVS